MSNAAHDKLVTLLRFCKFLPCITAILPELDFRCRKTRHVTWFTTYNLMKKNTLFGWSRNSLASIEYAFYYSVHKGQLLAPVLSHKNTLNTQTPCILEIYWVLTSYVCLYLPIGLYSTGFLTIILHAPVHISTCAPTIPTSLLWPTHQPSIEHHIMLCLNKHVINNKQINAAIFRKFIIVIQKHDFIVIFTLINMQSFADYITLVHMNCVLTHCGRVTQICVFNTVELGTSASSP